jgi:DNA-binding NarL/FixJ family response regulator
MKRIKIAIAEDHEHMRTTIIGQLAEFGLDIIIEAKDGKELLDELEGTTNLPDVCIIDVNMPKMDGFQTAEAVNSRWPAIKILALSIDPNNKEKMLEKGADMFLSKGSDPETLYQTIIKLSEY